MGWIWWRSGALSSPTAHCLLPLVGDFGEDVETGRSFMALGVVGGEWGEAAGPILLMDFQIVMQVVRGHSEHGGLAADFVE